MTSIAKLRFEQQVAILIGLLCLSLVGTLLAGTIWIGRRQSVDLISKTMAELAGNMASALDSSMFERFREMRVMSELQPLQSAWRLEPDQIRHVLDTLQTSLPTYAWIGFATSDGIVRAATKGTLEGSSVAERPWFKHGLVAPSVSDVHEAKLLARYMGAAPGADPFRFVDISMPVFDQNHGLIGVLGAHMSWTWADEVRQNLLASHASRQTTDVWILSSAGRVLLGPAFDSAPYDSERLNAMRSAGRGVFEDADRHDAVLTGYALTSGFRDYPGLGWIVVARQPAGVAFRPVADMVRTTLILGSGVATLSIVLAWTIARRAAAPVRHLTKAARLIGRDPTMTMLPRLGGSREFVELSASLRSLLRRIGLAEEQLTLSEEQSVLNTRQLRAELETLRHVADTDALTGLLNRRAFLLHAEDAMSYFRRYRRSIAVLVVDIDFFKRVNDKYGHAAGDDVIKKIGETLTGAVRTTDKVARFGGEEFVVLLREISTEDAFALAGRICTAVRSGECRHDGTSIRVTVSIGVAAAKEADRDVEALIERADRALYDAKHRGRDGVVFDEHDEIPSLDVVA